MTPRTLDRPQPVEPVTALPSRDSPAEPARSKSRWWLWLLLLLLAGGIAYAGYRWFTRPGRDGATAAGKPGEGRGGPGGAAGRPVPVVAAPARKGDMPIYLTGLGTVTPLNTVTVRTRVDGQLDQVAFIEGQEVKEGDLLAQVDPRPFENQKAQAEGQLLKDQAALNNAKADLERYRRAEDAVAQQQVASQEATVTQFEGAVKIDQAAIDNAKLQLTYARITAPISGRIGLKYVDQGNIVHATDTNGIAVISQEQPISVVFSLPQDNIPQILKSMGAGPKLVVDAFDRDLKNKLATGSLLAIDNQVDPTSGTVRLKGEFPNEDRGLFPNQFVNARLLVDTRRDAILVPSAAVQRGPDSTFVYVVKPDETVELRTVIVGPTEGRDTLIERGLAPREVVVTDGVDKLQPGTKVAVRQAGTTRPGGATRPGGGAGRTGGNDQGGAGSAESGTRPHGRGPQGTTEPATRPAAKRMSGPDERPPLSDLRDKARSPAAHERVAPVLAVTGQKPRAQWSAAERSPGFFRPSASRSGAPLRSFLAPPRTRLVGEGRADDRDASRGTTRHAPSPAPQPGAAQ